MFLPLLHIIEHYLTESLQISAKYSSIYRNDGFLFVLGVKGENAALMLELRRVSGREALLRAAQCLPQDTIVFDVKRC